MNWPLAISRNRSALFAVVAGIVALVGGRGMITRRLRNAVLALLRPAESAARRLIVMAARGMVATRRPSRAPPGALGARAGRDALRTPAFRLFDPPKRFARRRIAAPPRGVPRIRSFWKAPPAAAPQVVPRPGRDAPVDGRRLALRLAALQRALADLPRQARRLARWRARTANAVPPKRLLRLGRPPGWRARPERPIDLVLRECHRLAFDALADTS